MVAENRLVRWLPILQNYQSTVAIHPNASGTGPLGVTAMQPEAGLTFHLGL